MDKAQTKPAPGRVRSGAAKAARKPARILLYAVAILAAFYSFWPIMIMGLEGYNIDLGVIFAGRALIINIGGLAVAPKTIIPTDYFYLQALSLEAYPRLVADTLVVAALAIGIALAVGIPVAYVLARIDVRGKTFISYLLLALRTMSQFVVIIPLYVAFSRFGQGAMKKSRPRGAALNSRLPNLADEPP